MLLLLRIGLMPLRAPLSGNSHIAHIADMISHISDMISHIADMISHILARPFPYLA